MIETTKTIYVANDGKEFATPEEALAHESKLALRASNRTFWKVSFIPDIMFGDLMKEYFVEVKLEDKTLAREFLEDYCFFNYGSKINYLNGDIPVVSWAITRLDPKDFPSVEELSSQCLKLALNSDFQTVLEVQH